MQILYIYIYIFHHTIICAAAYLETAHDSCSLVFHFGYINASFNKMSECQKTLTFTLRLIKLGAHLMWRVKNRTLRA